MDIENNIREPQNIINNIRNGSVEEVENFLKRSFSTSTFIYKSFLLHLAVEYSSLAIFNRKKCSYLKIAELLLNYGADLNNYDFHNQTPLHLALVRGNIDMVQVLLNKQVKNLNFVRKWDLFFNNYLEESQQVVDFLLKNGNDFKITEKEYPILLKFAAQNGDETSFENILMMKSNFDINYLFYFSGSTIFHTVIEKGTCKMVKDLVNHGADINKKNENGDTPLHSAIKLRQFHHVSFLLECGASVFETDAKDQTVLHLVAQSRGNAEIIKMILSKGIDVNVTNLNDNETPLHLACGSDLESIETVKNFIKNGADINIGNRVGDTIFHKACAVGNFEIVSYLIKIGVDINLTGSRNQNALHFAIMRYKVVDLIRLLLLKRINVNGRDIHGKSAIHYVIYNKSHEDHLIMKLLIKFGVDINQRDNQGNTALHEISKNPGFHNLVELFLELGADVNAQNIYGETPLCCILNIGFYSFNFRYLSTNIKSLVMHLSKMKALNLYVCEKNLESLEHVVVSDLYKDCNREIYQMRSKICGRNISLLDFLFKDVRKLAAIVRNEEVSHTLNSYSYEEKFPNFGEFLERKIKAAQDRAFLLQIAVYIFNDRLKAKFPELVNDKICGYLKEKELNFFADAFEIRNLK